MSYCQFYNYLRFLVYYIYAESHDTQKLKACDCIFPEYATVGYMAKRIQMRKNRFLAIQKIAEQKKAGMDTAHAPPPGPPGEGDHAPKQTVSVASQNCSTIPRGHDAPHAQPHGVTTPPHRNHTTTNHSSCAWVFHLGHKLFGVGKRSERNRLVMLTRRMITWKLAKRIETFILSKIQGKQGMKALIRNKQ